MIHKTSTHNTVLLANYLVSVIPDYGIYAQPNRYFLLKYTKQGIRLRFKPIVYSGYYTEKLIIFWVVRKIDGSRYIYNMNSIYNLFNSVYEYIGSYFTSNTASIEDFKREDNMDAYHRYNQLMRSEYQEIHDEQQRILDKAKDQSNN